MPHEPRRRRKLSYANVMSTLAVFLMLAGGTAVAAGLGKNSVNSRTVKNSSLTGADLKNGSASGVDVADGSLGAAKFPAASLNASDVADGSLKGADVRDGAASAVKIANGTVGLGNLGAGVVGAPNVVDGGVQGADIGSGVLTGKNIDESTLAEVPDALLLSGRPRAAFLDRGKVIARETPIETGTASAKIDIECGGGEKLISGGPANVAPTSTILEDFPVDDIWVVRLDTHGIPDPYSVSILCVRLN